MKPQVLRTAVLFCAFALALSIGAAAYSDISLGVTINVDKDGRAFVSERSLISLDSKTELDEFSYMISSGKGSVVEWKRFSPNVKYHIGGTLPPKNSRVTAKRDFTTGYSTGVVILDYELDLLVIMQQSGSRVTRYALSEGMLGFEGTATSQGAETVLPSDVTLSIGIPSDAFITKISPEPNKHEGNTLTWTGPLTSKWVLEYEREKPLSEEVNEFFSGLAGVVAALPWNLVIALAFLALGGLALYWLVKRS
jgi:hypothetical protein